MTLTEAEMIARYDAERSGSIYLKDTPLSDLERRALDILFPEPTGNEPSGKRFCDAIDRMFDLPDDLRAKAIVLIEGFLAAESFDQRFDRAIDNIADLPEPRRAAGLDLVEGFLTGVAIAKVLT
jgi:hypothetical protein